MSSRSIFLPEKTQTRGGKLVKIEGFSKGELSQKLECVIGGQSFTDKNWRCDSWDTVARGRSTRIPHVGYGDVVGGAREG